MPWYKIASSNFSIWLTDQLKKLTNDLTEELPPSLKDIFEDAGKLNLIEKWAQVKKINLSKWKLLDAYTEARYYQKELKDVQITQNTNPDFDNFAVDLQEKKIPISASIKNKISNELSKLGNYHDQIPIGPIFDILKKYNITALQEDGTEWSGFLVGGEVCGSEGATNQRIIFSLAMKTEDETYHPTKNGLYLSWCVMEGSRHKYEVVSYIS